MGSSDEKNEQVLDIVKFLKREGYNLADPAGYISSTPDINGVGILYTERNKRYHVGTLWLQNEHRKADRQEKWVLEVFGLNYSDNLMNLSEKLKDLYDVLVDVYIGSLSSQLERRL